MDTTWRLRLKELVSAPLKKLSDLAGYSQKKLASVANATSQLSKQSLVTAGSIRKSTGSLSDLSRQLKTLEGLQAKAFDPKHIQNYEKAIQKVKSEISKWNAMKQAPEPPMPKQDWWQRMKESFTGNGKVPGMGDGIKEQLGNQLSVQGFNPFEMLASPKLAAVAGIALLTTGMVKATGIAKDFNEGMAKINATAQLDDSVLKKLDNRLTEIGSNSGGNFDNITAAYEKILSTTGKVNLSLDITETAVKGAQAGFADLDLVGGALAQTLASVGNKNATANEVLDTLLKAKAVGAGEFADFANYLPGLIASAKNVGIAYKDTAALFAYMTFKGQSATDAAMLMQNMFTSLQKKDIIVGLKSKGIDMFNVDGSRKNIGKLFLEITSKLKGLTDAQKTKFMLDIGLNDAQARQAWSVLTDDAVEFKRIMAEVNNSLGETDRQLAKTTNYTREWGNVLDDIKAIGKGLGDFLLPIVDTLIQGLKSFGKGVKDEIFGMAILKKSSWRNQSDDEIKKNARIEQARIIAENRTREYFGKLKPNDKNHLNPGQNFNRVQFAFYKSIYDQNTGETGNPKNKIDPNEKNNKKQTPLGKLTSIDTTNFEDEKKAKKGKADGQDGNGGNHGPRTLIQNLKITNHINGSDEVSKLADMITDDIVDAGRDGLVTLGIE